MSRENKTFQVKIETKGVSTNDAGQEFGHLECYAAVFNVIDQGNDQILPGAFKRTIKNAKDRAISRQKKYLLPILWQHDPNNIIGGWHTLSEDSYGLKCIGDISLATQRGREYWELAKADMSDSFSIVYDIPNGGSTYNKSGVRELSELRLFSCDPVTFPMCEETLLVSVKSKDKPVTKDKNKPARKDFNTLFQATQAADALEDWCDLVDTLTQAMMQAFCIGDEPQPDMGAALEQFSAAVDKWTANAVECGLPDYVSDKYGYMDQSTPYYVPYSMRMGGYDSMSRHEPLEQKAGKPISAANQSNIDDHVANVHAIANEATKSMKSSMKAIHDAADAFAEKMQGNQADSDNPDEQDDQTEKSYASALRELKALKA